jgi:hypothetical protein
MSEQNEELEKQKEHVTEMYEQFAKQVQEMDPKDMQRLQEFLSMYRNKDPRDYMTPTQREIAYLSLEELEQEYNLVQSRESNRGRAQRDLIVSRWEYEQKQKEKQNNTEQ